MKQCSLTLSLLLLPAFIGLPLQFSSGLLRAAQTAVSSATPVATATAGMSPTATPMPEPPSVRWVGVRGSKGEKRGVNKAYAERGDEIWVDVINFQGWLKSLQGKKLITENLEKKDL